MMISLDKSCVLDMFLKISHRNSPIVFMNWFLSILIAIGWMLSEVDDRIFARSNNISFSRFDSYNFWIYSLAACEQHQIQTTTVCLSTWQLSISMPASFNWLVRKSVSCVLGFVPFRRSSIFWWSSHLSVNDAPQFVTSTFITAKNRKRRSHLVLS